MVQQVPSRGGDEGADATTEGVRAMRRERIRERIKVRPVAPRERISLQVLPIDPRDPLILRAKKVRRSEERP
jgi:hypothetical protein